MASTGDIHFDVERPARWARVQIFLRGAILALLALLGARAGWIFGAFYWALPIIAALSIQRDGAGEYPTRNGRAVLRVLHWWNAFVAYMLLVSDRFPAGAPELEAVRFDVTPSGAVDLTRALLRIVSSLPEFVVIILLGWVASALAVVGALWVLCTERVPDLIVRFELYYTALQARWLAYHASLVDSHPLLDAAPARTH
jgi:hypothetical protein